MKILITGTTATQSTVRASQRNLTFTGQIVDALRRSTSDYEIFWGDPSMTWTDEYLNSFDTVIVGLAPYTGLGSTRAFGAYNIIGRLWDSPKLRLLIDAKNPEQITHSLNSVLKDVDSQLAKSFYSARQEYGLMYHPAHSEWVYQGIYQLANATWPKTIYPSFPWEQQDPTKLLPQGAQGRLYSLNLDILTLTSRESPELYASNMWVSEDCDSAWCTKLGDTLAYGIAPIKPTKFSQDDQIIRHMKSAIGVIIPPARRGRTWWTPKLALALKAHVPIVTAWEESEGLGDAWSVLAAQIEHMSDQRRVELSEKQYTSYVGALGDEDLAVESVETVLGLKKGIQWPTNSN